MSGDVRVTLDVLGSPGGASSGGARRLTLMAIAAFALTACHGDRWTEAPEPTSGDLRAVWGSSASDVWAVGRDGAAAHWDGTAWTKVTLPVTSDVEGVWGSAPNDVWAAGGGSAAGHGASSCGLLHFDGAAWSTRACPPGAESSALLAVHGSAANDVWAVGVGPTAIHWDGNRWATTTVPPRDGRLTGVYSAGPKDAWAVGRSAVYHFDGGAWSVAAPGSAPLRGVWGRGGEVWAYGETGGAVTLQHREGGAWSTVSCPATGGPDPIEGAWGAATGDVFFAQADGDVYRVSGGACRALKRPDARRVHAIWGAEEGSFWLVGEEGRTFRHEK